MSTETVKQFWQKARQDAGLQKKLLSIQGKDRQATLAAVVTLAGEAGFALTAHEYDAAVREELTRQHSAGEMTQEQLDSVAGGGVVTYGATYCTLLSDTWMPSVAVCKRVV
jgi:predicted ribosomally synthesized peptide with nif11-like leader